MTPPGDRSSEADQQRFEALYVEHVRAIAGDFRARADREAAVDALARTFARRAVGRAWEPGRGCLVWLVVCSLTPAAGWSPGDARCANRTLREAPTITPRLLAAEKRRSLR